MITVTLQCSYAKYHKFSRFPSLMEMAISQSIGNSDDQQISFLSLHFLLINKPIQKI